MIEDTPRFTEEEARKLHAFVHETLCEKTHATVSRQVLKSVCDLTPTDLAQAFRVRLSGAKRTGNFSLDRVPSVFANTLCNAGLRHRIPEQANSFLISGIGDLSE